MKKILIYISMFLCCLLGSTATADAQEKDSTQVTETKTAVADTADASDKIADEQLTDDEEFSDIDIEEGGIHQELKNKFIEGDAAYMSLVALAFVIGLALCIERIIYLNLSEIDSRKLIKSIEGEVEKGNIEGAKEICRNTRGPVASICYEGLAKTDEGTDAAERAIVSYANVQSTNLEQHCSWIVLFIAMAPSLGFLGTVIGMVKAFEAIEMAGDINPNTVAGGMRVALITTIFGIIVALILQIFYNYILSKIESLTSDMEDSSIQLLDIISRHNRNK